MNGSDYKHIKELFDERFKFMERRFTDFEKRFDSFDKRLAEFNHRLDDIIVSFNNYKNTTKQYVDCQNKEQQKQIDNHCRRIRKLEVVEAVNTTKLTIIIAAVVLVAMSIWDAVVDSIRNFFHLTK